MESLEQDPHLSRLRAGYYDFVDFGCSSGGSMDFAVSRCGGVRGLGFDLDANKVNLTREKGHDAVRFDILKVGQFGRCVDFVIMSHFLEHLDFAQVPEFVKCAIGLSRKFILIQQPFFDRSIDLFEAGLKLAYSDWTGHRNRMTTLDLFLLLRDLHESGQISEFSVGAFLPITSTSDQRIVPLNSPSDTVEYEPTLGPKPSVNLPSEMFVETWAVATIDGSHGQHRSLARSSKTFFTTSSD